MPLNAYNARSTPAAALVMGLIMTGCASDSPPVTYTTAGTPPTMIAAPTRKHGGASSHESRTPLKSAFLAYYRKWSEVPYRYGGTSRSGIDCSAFVKQATASVRDLWLPRTTLYQVQRGHVIPRSQLRVGDLVFFKTGGGSRHVGIYIGSGRFMHASSSSGVTISRMDNVYWQRHFWQARRLSWREARRDPAY